MFKPNDAETKIYVAGLPWVTKTEGLRSYFEQLGEIVNANVVCDRATGRSKGFGFVTFRDAESAARACEDPNPIIDGRVTDCKLAYLGARVHNGQPVVYYVVPPYWNQFYSQYNQQYNQNYPWFGPYQY